MLDALGGPGERSILYQKKRMGEEQKDESKEDEELKEEEDVRTENDGSISEPLEEWSDGEKRGKEEEYEEKHGNSEEENMTEDEKGKQIFLCFVIHLFDTKMTKLASHIYFYSR